MRVEEYADCDATALAKLMRDKQVSAEEVYATALEAIAAVDGTLHAVANGPWERPLEHASDGPFAGVPFAIKDLGGHPRGVPVKSGTRLSGDGIVFERDSYLIDRFRRAGLASAAMTTAPEFGFNVNSAALAYGEPTRNPWNLERSAGGSSGGSAVPSPPGGAGRARGRRRRLDPHPGRDERDRRAQAVPRPSPTARSVGGCGPGSLRVRGHAHDARLRRSPRRGRGPDAGRSVRAERRRGRARRSWAPPAGCGSRSALRRRSTRRCRSADCRRRGRGRRAACSKSCGHRVERRARRDRLGTCRRRHDADHRAWLRSRRRARSRLRGRARAAGARRRWTRTTGPSRARPQGQRARSRRPRTLSTRDPPDGDFFDDFDLLRDADDPTTPPPPLGERMRTTAATTRQAGLPILGRCSFTAPFNGPASRRCAAAPERRRRAADRRAARRAFVRGRG